MIKKKKLTNQKTRSGHNFKKRMVISAIIISLIMGIVIFITISAVNAEDFGVMGKTWDIKEKDAVVEIQDYLGAMTSGELDEHNQIIKKKVEEKIRNPNPLNVKRTEVARVFSYDPSIVINEDLKDAKGVVFHKKGTRVNPLDTVSMKYELIFFDGRDDKQLDYAINRYNDSEIKPVLILTGGSPIEIEEKYKIDAYFDQKGLLIKKFGIIQVPAVIAQDGKVLNIREVKVD
jgi:conjugal transfer pilus assembly protein TraW